MSHRRGTEEADRRDLTLGSLLRRRGGPINDKKNSLVAI